MRLTLIIAGILAILFFGQVAMATTVTTPSSSTIDTTSSSTAIPALTQAVNQSSLSDEEKNDLILQLQQASSWILSNSKTLDTLNTQQQNVELADKRKITLNDNLAGLEKRLEDIQNITQDSMSDERLNQLLNDAQTALDLANSNYLKWDRSLNQLQGLAANGANQKFTLEQTLETLTEVVSKKVMNKSNDITSRVSNLSLLSRKELLKNNLKLLDFQLDNLGDLSKNAQIERDYWQKDKTIELQIVNHLQNILQVQKTQQAESELQQTVKEQLDPSSPLYSIQENTIKVQQEKANLINQEQQIQQRINYIISTNNAIEADFSRDKQIVALEGSREIIAQVLHKRVESLANYSVKESTILKIKDQLNNIILSQILLSEKLREANQQSAAALIAKTLSTHDFKDPIAQHKIESQLLTIQANYIDSANELQSLYPDFISKLSELNSLYNKRQQLIGKYSHFLHNNLLWLPNVQASSLLSVNALTSSINWFFDPKNSNALFSDLKEGINKQKTMITGWLLFVMALIFLRKRFIRGLEETASQIISVRTDSFIYTLKAVGFTLAISITAPIIFAGFASLLNDLSNPSEYSQRLINSFFNASILLFILGGLQQICRKNGLAQKHFRWQQTTYQSIYRVLKWVVPIAAVLIILIGLNTDSTGPSDRQVLGRLGFIGLMILIAIALFKIWGSSSNIVKNSYLQTPRNSLMQLHFIWFPLLLLIPAFLIWSTISGYYYSSLMIAERLNWTIGLILTTYIFRELLLRSIYISERKQHFLEKVKQQEALYATRQADDQNSPKESADIPPIEVDEINYDKLSNQIRQTVNLGFIIALFVGIWLVWSDLLLALNLVNDSTLPLTKSQVIDGVIQQVPLTLGDLSQGLILGFVTLLLAKNLPGILEFTLLKYLPISNAARYAVSSLTQYVIAIIGFVLIFRAMGIEWSNIQWLVAALSVGLGFGLQEIVANFVSGIILLFEQPIRVGDIVTVDGVTGKVSRIRIRATTIVNWERQELVIPNKQIITGQLINWTLSDPINRVKVEVGIAYGSNVEQAMKLMLEAANEHPSVLTDPEPTVVFDAFGDNSLNFILRCFVDDLDQMIITRSSLHEVINNKFSEAGIEISFPQRDVHLNTSSPLEIQVTQQEKHAK
ncbi:mechanosensitive ion channel [Thiomicrorhabdus hydrogeniphila]